MVPFRPSNLAENEVDGQESGLVLVPGGGTRRTNSCSYVRKLLRDPRTKQLSQDPRLMQAFAKAYAHQSPTREWVLVHELLGIED